MAGNGCILGLHGFLENWFPDAGKNPEALTDKLGGYDLMAATKTKKAKKATKKSTNLQPIGDRIVVEREESLGTTAGGILLPESAKDKPSRGTVIAVGNGRLLKDGSRGELQLKAGDKVLFTSYGPDEIKLGEAEFLLMREDDVLAVIE